MADSAIVDALMSALSKAGGVAAQTWPGRIAQSLVSAARLPGDVYSGATPISGPDAYTNPEVIDRSADLAGVMTGTPQGVGGLGSGMRMSQPGFYERMEAAKDIARARYNKGAAQRASFNPIYAPVQKGSFEDFSAQQMQAYRDAVANAVDQYRRSVGIAPENKMLLAPGETINDIMNGFL